MSVCPSRTDDVAIMELVGVIGKIISWYTVSLFIHSFTYTRVSMKGFTLLLLITISGSFDLYMQNVDNLYWMERLILVIHKNQKRFCVRYIEKGW